jgi:hypothetical protein
MNFTPIIQYWNNEILDSHVGLCFNLIYDVESEKYYFVDIHHDKPPSIKARQFLSWNGITPEIAHELKVLGFEKKWPNTLNWYDFWVKKLDESNRHLKQWIKSLKN